MDTEPRGQRATLRFVKSRRYTAITMRWVAASLRSIAAAEANREVVAELLRLSVEIDENASEIEHPGTVTHWRESLRYVQ